MAAHPQNHKVIYAALAGNLMVALTKFVAAWITSSSAMLSEGVHSLVDTGNQFLLLYGLRRAARPPDEAYPLGYGRELYFWSFIVALLVFALGRAFPSMKASSISVIRWRSAIHWSTMACSGSRFCSRVGHGGSP